MSKAAEAASRKASTKKQLAAEVPKLKSQYGVDAWKRWIQWRQTQPNLEKPRFGCKSAIKPTDQQETFFHKAVFRILAVVQVKNIQADIFRR